MRIGNKRYWIFQLCGWGTVVLMNLFFSWSFGKLQSPVEQRMFLVKFGILFSLGLFFTHMMRLVIIEINLLQKKLEKQIPVFAVLTFVFSIVSSAIYVLLLQRLGYLLEKDLQAIKENGFLLVILISAVNFFSFYFIWNLIYFMYHYIAKSQKQQLDTLQLESLVKELELKTIKAHINPHFIFNSLNSIRALVDENPERARKAITELSNILRSSINVDKSETVTFEKELAIVKDYLALENMRFEDRLKVEYEVDDDTLDRPVPPMMLQTLVENAIKHGISKQINGGIVRVISDLNGHYHELTVQNTGHLNGKVNEEGFGLSSTNDRLHLLYGEKGRFEIRQISPLLVEATVKIPVPEMQ